MHMAPISTHRSKHFISRLSAHSQRKPGSCPDPCVLRVHIIYFFARTDLPPLPSHLQTHTHTHTHTYTHTHTCIHTYTDTQINTDIHTHSHTPSVSQPDATSTAQGRICWIASCTVRIQYKYSTRSQSKYCWCWCWSWIASCTIAGYTG
jgi:hypothetical protein